MCMRTAVKMLQEVAMKLVKESFGDTYYDKAMECVQALRAEAVRVSTAVLELEHYTIIESVSCVN